MQAKDYCITVGGKLADITDQRSQDFVRRYGDPNIFWWLGGYKASNVSVLWDMSNIAVLVSFQTGGKKLERFDCNVLLAYYLY